MRWEEAIGLLRQHCAEIAAHGVGTLYLFGSIRRDEAGPDSSDVVARADLTTRGGLHSRLRDDIPREAERVF